MLTTRHPSHHHSTIRPSRDGMWEEAAVRATRALKLHPGSSRLWALLVQLRLQTEAFTPDLLELGTMNPVNVGNLSAEDKEKMYSAATTEMEYRVELFNK